MSRLLLNADDLSKLRVSPLGPFSETLFSLRSLQKRQPSPLVGLWQSQVSDALERPMSPLLAVSPAARLIDLHTVVGEAPHFGDAMQRLEGAPVELLSAELNDPPSPPPGTAWAQSWLRDLSDGNRRARRQLVELFQAYHGRAVLPYWPAIRTHLEADRAHRGQVMAARGIDGLLRSLHPQIRWRPPFLDICQCDHPPGGPRRDPIVADGRSLVLAPTVFGHDAPHLLHSMGDHTSPFVLTYPVLRTVGDAMSLWAHEAPRDHALAELLGRTRARALEIIADTCTTTELARRLGVSAATASHHVGALRHARLIMSVREGTRVRHRIVARGAALLDGNHVAEAQVVNTDGQC